MSLDGIISPSSVLLPLQSSIPPNFARRQFLNDATSSSLLPALYKTALKLYTKILSFYLSFSLLNGLLPQVRRDHKFHNFRLTTHCRTAKDSAPIPIHIIVAHNFHHHRISNPTSSGTLLDMDHSSNNPLQKSYKTFTIKLSERRERE